MEKPILHQHQHQLQNQPQRQRHHQRQRKTKCPCSVCGFNPASCLCEWIPKLELLTKVSLVVHLRELKRTTNTGRLAVAALRNSELRIRGEGREPLDLSDLLEPSYRSLLFYPCEEAQELTPQFVAQSSLPIHLIVPDGNWRQASKVHYRHKELAHIPRVMISQENTALYHLRAESSSYGMATLQAIALALSVIEGPIIGDQLMHLYNEKLKRTLQARGVQDPTRTHGL